MDILTLQSWVNSARDKVNELAPYLVTGESLEIRSQFYGAQLVDLAEVGALLDNIESQAHYDNQHPGEDGDNGSTDGEIVPQLIRVHCLLANARSSWHVPEIHTFVREDTELC